MWGMGPAGAEGSWLHVGSGPGRCWGGSGSMWGLGQAGAGGSWPGQCCRVLAPWGGGPGSIWGGSLQSWGPDGVIGSPSVPCRWPEPRVQEDPDVRPQEAGPCRPGRGSQAGGGRAAGACPARGPQPVLQALRLRRPQAHGPVSLSARRPPDPARLQCQTCLRLWALPGGPGQALSPHPMPLARRAILKGSGCPRLPGWQLQINAPWCPLAVLVPLPSRAPPPSQGERQRNCRGS